MALIISYKQRHGRNFENLFKETAQKAPTMESARERLLEEGYGTGDYVASYRPPGAKRPINVQTFISPAEARAAGVDQAPPTGGFTADTAHIPTPGANEMTINDVIALTDRLTGPKFDALARTLERIEQKLDEEVEPVEAEPDALTELAGAFLNRMKLDGQAEEMTLRK